MDLPRRSLEFRLLDQADKIRLVLVGLFLVTLYTLPRSAVAHFPIAATVITFYCLYVLFGHFVLNWHLIRREGRVHLMAALMVCVDVLFMSVFVWALGPDFNNLSLLLLLDVVFAAAFFSGFELPLVTGLVCGAMIALGASAPPEAHRLHAQAGMVGATVVVAWLAYAMAEVARHEKATSDRIVRFLTEGVMLITGNGEIAVVNPRIEHMFGVDGSKLVGLNIRDPANAAALEPLSCILEDIPTGPDESERTRARQLHIENPNPMDVETLIVPCAAPGTGQSAWVIVCKDITQVLTKVRVKEEGLAVITHELRGRLHSVRASSEVLIRMADHLTPQVRAEALRLLDSETRRLSRLIGRTLEAAAMEDGSDNMQFEDLCLNSLVREACGGLISLAREKNQTITVETSPARPRVWADATRLDQVVCNLVENAVKFTPEGGRIQVTVSSDGDAARVSVADNGCGVEPEMREAIFEKFTHGESGAAGYVSGGLGLGLFLCREIVHKHGGEITCDSVRGRGSTFTFTLPLARAAEIAS